MFDLAVVGAGIVGLGHALAAARRGLDVLVVDRDAQANGASIRNFGLVVVTGQRQGEDRRRAERSRDIWLEIAGPAGIAIEHRGLLVAARRPEAMALLEAYAATGIDGDCRLLSRGELLALQPQLEGAALAGGLHGPQELRVESRLALPRLADHLARRFGVEFRFGTTVTDVAPPVLETSAGRIEAAKVIVCPGDDLTGLYGAHIAAREVTRCKLQMLRLADPGFRLRAAIVSDLSLLRYGGFADLPAAAPLRRRLEAEQPEMLANGVHVIAVQSADGSLVVGDSHHYAPTPDPFASQLVDRLILDEFEALFGPRRLAVSARWTGTYSSAAGSAFRDAPHPDVRLVMVTSGTGASTGFAIGEETVAELFD
ncbi:MAG: TIGR03364 family FAD-dependent oxidoreductase [Rhizobiales bacterium]|nr:TIGR03364 family FAD-dependent oxidoreductase [Hyphomicrobiales bacterium]